MEAAVQRAIGQDLCEALGIESRQVVSVTLRIKANSPVVAEVEYLPTKEQARAAVAVLGANKEAVQVQAAATADDNAIVIVNQTAHAMDAVVDAMRSHGGRLHVVLRDAMSGRGGSKV